LGLGFLVDDVESGVCFAICFMTPSADPMNQFRAQSFIGF